ncbi:alpha/beta hydrolase [Streptomyces sp. NPDC048301]|uniref:alpha/beta fold hydrolase n=1 Tax=Streptomyces sp. NPDC048301 TaxID=3155631 RepID=UPI003429A09C
MIPYEEMSVPVTGGELAALRWPSGRSDAPVAVALHGITANALSWGPVARALDGRVTLVAPDLRGRAASAELPGPYGIGAHADDVAALAEALGGDRVVLAGHSMGAFVAALTAVRNPDRFGGPVLVDGGFGFPAPTGLSADELLTAVIGPAMERLSMTFPDREAYRSFWRAHPAFAGDAWTPEVDAYIQRDLTGEEPALRSGCRLEAIRTDGVDLFRAEVLAAAGELPSGATLLWAERGLMDEEQGLYDESRLAAAGQPDTAVRAVRVEGVNHYTVLTGDKGADRVARAILEAVR